MTDSSIFSQLYQRKMFRISAGYLAVAWVLWQVVVTTCEAFECSPEFQKNIFWLLVVGLPATLAVAWVNWKTAILVGIAFISGAGIAVVMVTTSYTPPVETVVVVPADPLPPIIEEPEQERLPNSVAVLPFENLSPHPDDAFFAAGIHEEVLFKLAEIKNLSVISRTSVLNTSYTDGSMTVPKIAEELNVETVMEGSVRYADNRVRITAQLIDAITDEHLWQEIYERDLSDIWAVQTDIARNIANALEAELSPEEQLRIEANLTTSTDAMELYLKSSDSNSSISGDLRDRYLHDAILADPEFARAYAHRAYRAGATSSRYSELSMSERATHFEQAINDAEKALSLDPGLGYAYVALGRIYNIQGNVDQAKTAYERALDMSPNDTEVLDRYAGFINTLGENQKAIEVLNRAIKIDPGNAELYDALGDLLSNLSDHKGAVEAYNKAFDLGDRSSGLVSNLSINEALLGNISEALSWFRVLEFRLATVAGWGTQTAYGYSRLDRQADANRVIRKMKEYIARGETTSPANMAMLSLASGNTEDAILHIHKALEKPDELKFNLTDAEYFIRENLFNDPVLEQPEWLEVRRQLGYVQ